MLRRQWLQLMGDLAVLGSLAAGGLGAACAHPHAHHFPSTGPQRYRVASVVYVPYGASGNSGAAFSKDLVIDTGAIQFGDATCHAARAQLHERKTDADDYFDGFGLSKRDLGITAAQVTVVSTGCADMLGEYVISGGQIVLIWDGVAYRFERVD